MSKRKIKKLAKETLKNKWYLIRDGENIGFSSDCAFCHDARERAKYKQSACAICYIPKMSIDICHQIPKISVESIIELLEQLAKHGQIKTDS